MLPELASTYGSSSLIHPRQSLKTKTPAEPWPHQALALYVAFGLFLAAFFLLAASPARAAIYWENGNAIARANLDGTNQQPSFIPLMHLGDAQMICGDIAVDDSYIYWTNTQNNAVGRAAIDGTNPNYNFVPSATETCGVAVDRSHVYWANTGGVTVGRANVDGTDVTQDFIEGPSRPCGIEVNLAHVFWGNVTKNWLSRADLDGEGVVPNFIEEAGGGCGIAVAGDHIYWSDLAHSIGRANLDGSEVNYEFIAGLDRPCGIAIEGAYIFWAEQNIGNSGQIGRANLDGTGVNRKLIPEVAGPCGIAADDRLVPPPPPPTPPPALRAFFGKVKHGKGGPVTYVAVRIPQAGGLNALVSTPGIAWSLSPGRNGVSGPGQWWLKLQPQGHTKTGRRLLRRLKRKGRVAIGVVVEYIIQGRTAGTSRKTVSLLEARSQH
jgi:virginiamycin B lyase